MSVVHVGSFFPVSAQLCHQPPGLIFTFGAERDGVLGAQARGGRAPRGGAQLPLGRAIQEGERGKTSASCCSSSSPSARSTRSTGRALEGGGAAAGTAERVPVRSCAGAAGGARRGEARRGGARTAVFRALVQGGGAAGPPRTSGLSTCGPGGRRAAQPGAEGRGGEPRVRPAGAGGHLRAAGSGPAPAGKRPQAPSRRTSCSWLRPCYFPVVSVGVKPAVTIRCQQALKLFVYCS